MFQNGHPLALAHLSAFPLNATPVGSTNDAILRWDTSTLINTGAPLTVTDSAVDGTSFLVRAPGLWLVEFMLPQLASTTVLAGISLGATGAALTGNPAMNTAGVVATFGPYTLPAATTLGLYCATHVVVTSGVVGAGGNGATIRTHATDGSGATPTAAITEAGSWLKITYVARCG